MHLEILKNMEEQILDLKKIHWLYQKCRDWIVGITLWYPGTIETENVKQLSVFQVFQAFNWCTLKEQESNCSKYLQKCQLHTA